MKIKSISFSNLKKISNSAKPSMLCNPDLNVLVGANNAGKTSILQAIAAVFNIRNEEWHKSLSYHLKGNGKIEVVLAILLNKNEWLSLINIQASTQPLYADLLSDTLVTKLAEFSVNINVSFNFKDKKIISQTKTSEISDENLQELPLLQQQLKLLKNIIAQVARYDFYNAFGHPIYLEAVNMISPQEQFVAENTILNNRISNQHIRAKLYYVKQNDPQKFEDIKKEILNIFRDIKNFDVNLNLKEGTFEFLLHEDVQTNGSTVEVPYDVSDVGMGMQNLLVIVANILLLNPSVVLMDEPDAHMHPALVKDFINIIKKLSDRTQFFITTHSVPLIEAVELSNIYNLSYARETKGTVVRNITSRDEVLDTLENLGFSISNFQFVQKPNIYVFTEGLSDRDFILSFASKMEQKKNVNEFTVTFIPIEGKGDRFKLARLIDKLNNEFIDRPILIVLDRDEASPENIELFRNKYFSTNPKRLFYLTKRQIESYLLDEKALSKISLDKIKDEVLIENFKKENIAQKLFLLADLQKENIQNNYIEETFIAQSLIVTKDLRDILKNLKVKPLNDSIKEFSGELFRLVGQRTVELSNQTKSIVELFEEDWKDEQKRLAMCDGRELLKDMRNWLANEFKISFSNNELINCMDMPHHDIKELIEIIAKPDQLLIKN